MTTWDSRPALLAGLIGTGIGASLTPALHEREGAEQGLRHIYRLLDMERLGLGVEALPELLAAAERTGFAGVNITHPCKQAVIPLLHELSDGARALGAVNTVVLRDGKRIGHNTDLSGFAEGFKRGLPDAKRDRVVQMGAGGAGSAVAHALLGLGVGRLSVFDTDPARAETVAASLRAQFGEGRAVAGTDLPRRHGGGGRRGELHAGRHGEVPRPAAASGTAPPVALGGGDRLFPAGNGTAAHRAGARLRHAGRRRHGGVPGGRRLPPVHRAGAGRRADAAPLRARWWQRARRAERCRAVAAGRGALHRRPPSRRGDPPLGVLAANRGRRRSPPLEGRTPGGRHDPGLARRKHERRAPLPRPRPACRRPDQDDAVAQLRMVVPQATRQWQQRCS